MAIVAILMQSSVSQAGIIVGFATRSQMGSQVALPGQAPDEFALSIWEDTGCGEDRPAPSSAPQSPEQPVQKERQDLLNVDAGLDTASGTGTSAPVPNGGSAAQPGLVATAVQSSSSDAPRRITLIEDLVLESPPPLGLLDPPKDLD